MVERDEEEREIDFYLNFLVEHHFFPGAGSFRSHTARPTPCRAMMHTTNTQSLLTASHIQSLGDEFIR